MFDRWSFFRVGLSVQVLCSQVLQQYRYVKSQTQRQRQRHCSYDEVALWILSFLKCLHHFGDANIIKNQQYPGLIFDRYEMEVVICPVY